MEFIASGWKSRLGDGIAERLSRLYTSPTEPRRRFPEAVCFVLDQPDTLEVLALDPADHQNGDPPDRFHGHAILGRVAVDSPDERGRIGRALVAGNDRTEIVFKCFDPAIGVRAGRGSQSVSLAACFWCGNVEVAGPGGERDIFPLSGWPSRVLVRHLAAAGIAIAKRPV